MSAHTPGPWVGFTDEGRLFAIMPAGRNGDICTFKVPPSEADGFLMTAAPDLLKALMAVVAIADRKTVEFDRARAAIAKANGH